MDAGAGAGAGQVPGAGAAAGRNRHWRRRTRRLELKKQHEYIYIQYIYYIFAKTNEYGGNKQRKIIDIREETFKSLTVMAAMKGTNLKRYIENLLDEVAELHEDEVIYGYLASHRPEGKTQVGKEEKQDFESWLGVKEK